MKKLIAVIPLFIILAGCNQAAAPGDPSEITARSAEWNAALNAKDIDALAALYTDDARMMPPNAVMTVGVDGVRAAFGGMIDAGVVLGLGWGTLSLAWCIHRAWGGADYSPEVPLPETPGG